MIAELVEANPNVRADAGKVAVMRGPIIYCLEEVDNGANLSAILINTDNALRAVYDENLLGGAVVIHGKGLRTDESDWGNNLYRPFGPNEKEVPITAIPYFLWGNRGLGEMQTWIRHR
jgi:hypothetical protein